MELIHTIFQIAGGAMAGAATLIAAEALRHWVGMKREATIEALHGKIARLELQLEDERALRRDPITAPEPSMPIIERHLGITSRAQAERLARRDLEISLGARPLHGGYPDPRP